MILSKKEIIKRLDCNELPENERLYIRPFLDKEKQLGQVSVDFRLGTDFLVAIQGRGSFIDTAQRDNAKPISSFFQETRRAFGETFLLHPGQTVLATTLEYIKLPNDLLLELHMRSSYSRLGLDISTFAQPGYCGCVSIELVNGSHVPIQLAVGARIIQGYFCQVSNSTEYYEKNRKYVAEVRPALSSAYQEEDIERLKKVLSNM